MKWLPIALLSLASLVQADVPLYATCGGIGTLGGDGLVPGLSGLLTGTLTTLLGTTIAGNTCRGYAFMVFAKGIDVNALVVNLDDTLGSCYCTNSGLDANAVMEGSAGNPGECDTTVANLIGVKAEYIAQNPLSFSGCYANAPAPINTFTVSTQAECFSSCKGNNQVSIRAKNVREGCGILGGLLGALLGRSGGQWECSCSNTNPTGAQVTCNSETSSTGVCTILGGSKTYAYAWNVYARDPQATGFARRSNLRQRPLSPSEQYCPQPMVPCRIPNHDGFECVDVTRELESCGGCPSGSYVNSTAAAGIDCTSLPGTSYSGVSCVRGECVVSKCRRGYVLEDGQCVATRKA